MKHSKYLLLGIISLVLLITIIYLLKGTTEPNKKNIPINNRETSKVVIVKDKAIIESLEKKVKKLYKPVEAQKVTLINFQWGKNYDIYGKKFTVSYDPFLNQITRISSNERTKKKNINKNAAVKKARIFAKKFCPYFKEYNRMSVSTFNSNRYNIRWWQVIGDVHTQNSIVVEVTNGEVDQFLYFYRPIEVELKPKITYEEAKEITENNYDGEIYAHNLRIWYKNKKQILFYTMLLKDSREKHIEVDAHSGKILSAGFR